MKLFSRLVSVDEAISLSRKFAPIMQHENVPSFLSAGRICAETVIAKKDVPPYNRSMVDGFAVAARDTETATRGAPVSLTIGDKAIPVRTGDPMPPKKDAVFKIESVTVNDGVITFSMPIPKLKNIGVAGEDVKKGEVILKPGEIISPFKAAQATLAGIKHIKVFRKPRVRIFATGDEITHPDSDHGIPNTNVPMLAALLRECGVEVIPHLDPLPDDPQKIKNAALLDSDIIIFTGGTSVGEKDLTPTIADQIIFHGVAMRPGMPTGAGIVKGKIVFFLSGLPVAAWAGYELIVKPVLAHMIGRDNFPQIVQKLETAAPLPGHLGHTAIVRVTIEENKVYPIYTVGSGILSTLTKTHGYVLVPPDLEGYEPGEKVNVIFHSLPLWPRWAE